MASMQAHVRVVGAEEGELERLIKAGEQRAAAGMCARLHGPALGRLGMALLGSQADADEVAQETLLAAHDALASWRGDGSVRAWLFGIARRLCARRLETRTRQERRLHLVKEAAADGAPEAELHARRQALQVRALLERLRPSDREALLLRYEADLTFGEIAVACGIEEAAARKRASRGLDRLRTLMAGETREGGATDE
jgi:RNA polymerase sigma-70 factor, ECF subfamily